MSKKDLNIIHKAINQLEGKEKPDKIYYTADFINLIDIVLNDEEIKFLTSDGLTYSELEIDGLLCKPPPRSGLPPQLLLPRYSKIEEYLSDHTGLSGDSGICTGCTQLFIDLLKYHHSISELPTKDLYYLLAAWDFHTYALEKANFSPIIYFYSVAERGKSRTLKGMVNVARRGIRKIDIRDAQILRDCTHLRATIAFDMMDFWDQVKSAGSTDVILNRYERGATISRVNRPEKGAFQDVDYYDVFGATILATNEIIHDIADTRGIPIVMRKADRDYENEVIPQTGLEFKEKLTAWRLVHLADEFPKVDKPVKSRLGDITRPLLQIIKKVIPQKEELFIGLLKRIEKTKLTEKSNSIDAEILLSMNKSAEEGIIGGVVASQFITNTYNKDKDEKERLKSRRIGNILKSLGFKPTQTQTSALGFFWDQELLDKLLKEYGCFVVSTELSETSETTTSNNIKPYYVDN